MKLSVPPPPPPPPNDGTPGGNAPGSPEDPNANANNPQASAPASPAPDAPAAAPDTANAPEAAPAPAPAPRPMQWPSWYPGVDSALAGLVLVFAFAAASFVARNSDVWLHLAAGKRLFHGEYLPGSDPFSYSAADRPWVNHSWLTDAAAYLLYGGEGKVLVIAKAIVIALAFGVLMAIRRPQFSLWPWAVAACVGVLAAAPQFTLRPHVVSMLFLAVTLFVVFRMPRGANPWRLPIAIGVTFWLWANCDSWFILGPLALALLILGELIQQNMMNRAEPTEEEAEGEPLGRMPDLATLAKALGIGVVACMLTPHHVRVWELPFELFGAEGARDDPRLRSLMISVIDEAYFNSAGFGRNINGVAFAILVAGGAALLGLGSGRLRVSHVALWVGFLALAIFRISTIPFFAVVAVPLVAAQLNALSTRAVLKSWGDPKSRLLWVGSSLGRVVCVLAVSALCVLAYPGWVHPEASNPAYARRVAWGVEPDPLLVKAAEQLNQWREKEKLPPDARGVISNTDLANYVAWYAPREKVFINSRYNHHKPELGSYIRLRRGLGVVMVKDDPVGLGDATGVLKDAGADYLAISVSAGESGALRSSATRATVQLYELWPQWSPWYLDGQTVVFGWRPAGEKGKPEFAALRVDPVAIAFGPGAARLAEPELKPPLVELGWEEAFVRPARPAPPSVAEALGWLAYKDGLRRRQEQWGRIQANRQLQRTLGDIMRATIDSPQHQMLLWSVEVHGATPAPPDPTRPATSEPSGDAGSARAAAFLALRAARRAVLEDPDHPDAYFVLGLALNDPLLPFSVSERILATVTAYRQGLIRLPKPDRYRPSQYNFSAMEVAYQLAILYLGAENPIRGRDPKTGQPITVGFVGMPIDIPVLNALLGQGVLADSRGKIVRVPFANLGRAQLPPNLQLMTGQTPYFLAADVALETLRLALQYAEIETAGDSPDVAKERKRRIETLLKDAENQVVRSTEEYNQRKPRTPKLPELVDAAQAASLPGEATRLFDEKDKEEVKKEYGQRLPVAVLQHLGLEMALGRIENVASNLNDLDFVTAVEKAGFKTEIQLLRYHKSLLMGEYKTAGEVLEPLTNRAGLELEQLPPPGPGIHKQLVLDTIAARYQIKDPQEAAKVLASLLRPPVLLPIHPLMRPILIVAEAPHRSSAAELVKPRSTPVVLEGWTSDWLALTGLIRQTINAQMQNESSYQYRRGWLALLEGDIPTAEVRFRQATRKAPPGWGLADQRHLDASGYLRLIEIAKKKAEAP